MLSELPLSPELPCEMPLDLSNDAEAVPSTLLDEALSLRLVALGAVELGWNEASSAAPAGGTNSVKDILRPL